MSNLIRWRLLRGSGLLRRAGFTALLAGAAASPWPAPLSAQAPTGTLLVRVRADSAPLPGAFVRSGRTGAVADRGGVAQLELPGGLTRVVVSHPAFRPWTFEITIVPNAPQRVDADLERLERGSTGPVVAMLRGTRPVEEEPVPVEVVGGRRLTKAAQLQPARLSKVFDGIPGVRAQTMSGALGATHFRIRGLRGQYTGILSDGLPLLGGWSTGYRLPQLSPFDVGQVEMIQGASTTLYGPSALGGVLNLVSRRADRDSAQLALNQSSEKGGDVVFWGARRFSPTVGASLFTEFHQQRLVDADDDQWGDFPRAIRFSVRPRLFLDRPSGDELFATVGATTEDRTGGFLLSPADDDPYREELRTRRYDLGLRGRRVTGQRGRFEFRMAGVLQATSDRFDDVRERDRRSTLFGEAAYADSIGAAAVVLGVAYQRDAFRQRDLDGFDFTFSVPALFAHLTWSRGPTFSVAASGRCDVHNVHGTLCAPRLSVLAALSPAVRARLSAGTAYHVPTPLTDEVEVVGLRMTIPSEVEAERGQDILASLEWRRGRLAVTGAAGFTRLSHPVRLVPVTGDSAGRLRLVNAADPTRIVSGHLAATYRADRITAKVFYGYLNGTEGVPGDTGRRETDLTPRHSLGLDVAWQGPPNGPLADLRATYTGAQAVWDNPYRTRTPDYVIADLLVSQPMGRARLFVGAENLFGVRLRNYESVLLPAPTVGGRRTATPWAPLQGRVISFGALVQW